MNKADDARRVLDDVTARSFVVSTHDHLRPMDDHPRPMSVVDMLRDTYAAISFRDSDGSPNGMGPTRMLDEAVSWQEVDAVFERMRLTSSFRVLETAFTELYGLPPGKLTEASYGEFARAVADRYQDSGWLSHALDRARVVGVIWDNFWKPGEWQVPDERFAPSIRIDSSVAAVNAEGSDYVGCNVIRDWAGHFGIRVSVLDDLEDLIRAIVAANLEAGSRSFKAAIAYDRSLNVQVVRRDRAAVVFGRPSATLSAEDRIAFGDYVIGFCLELARANGMVFQVHTGTGRLAGSSPMNLIPLLERFPDVVFDLFHAGYPWTRESAALSRAYPNVRLNLTWLPNISIEVAVSVLKEWVQAVPQIGRITWGADAKTPEEMYGGVIAARSVVARALAELVEERQITLDDAVAEAERILWRNGVEIYGIDPSAQVTRLRPDA